MPNMTQNLATLAANSPGMFFSGAAIPVAQALSSSTGDLSSAYTPGLLSDVSRHATASLGTTIGYS